MKPRVFVIHSWSGDPSMAWYPWLKKELEQKGFDVYIPTMPQTDEPTIETWVPYLAQLVDRVDEQTFFVGHSIGCQTILRYLEQLPIGQKIGGVVFVAGWFNVTGLETEEDKAIAKPWVESTIDLEKIREHTDRFVAVFSDDDPFVPLSNRDIFEKELGAKVFIETAKGHLTSEDGINELPIVLQATLEIVNQ